MTGMQVVEQFLNQGALARISDSSLIMDRAEEA